MPQRTNDYQQLVHLIQMAPAPVGAKVNESVMIPGQDTLREIDVLIETDVGPYSVKIAVEAKDFKRPLNVTEIEAVIGKYSGNGGIAVNKVVVVAKRGFSDAAEKRAKEARIELLTIKEAKESDWSKLAPETMCFRMEPHIDRVDLVPPISATSSGGNPISNGRIVCKCHGNDKGSPAQWANWFLKTQVLPNTALLERLEQEAKRRGGQSWQRFLCRFPATIFCTMAEPVRLTNLYLMSIMSMRPERESGRPFKWKDQRTGPAPSINLM